MSQLIYTKVKPSGLLRDWFSFIIGHDSSKAATEGIAFGFQSLISPDFPWIQGHQLIYQGELIVMGQKKSICMTLRPAERSKER